MIEILRICEGFVLILLGLTCFCCGMIRRVGNE